MKHYLKIFLVAIAFLFLVNSSGCSKYVIISKIEMKNQEIIEIKAGDFSYEGKTVVIFYGDGTTKEIDLTEELIPEVEKLKFYKMGEHEVEVVYYDRYKTTMKIRVVRHEFEDIYELVGYTCKYDGQPHKVELNYELPEGAKIDYPYGNTFTNAGVYKIEGVISKSGYNVRTLETTLVIEKADYDMSEVIFEDTEFAYDGDYKTIVATNIPEGIEVTYDIFNQDKTIKMNKALNAGNYVVVANFVNKDDNYNSIPAKEAILTINKATYDMSKVSMKDYTKEFDDLEYVAKLDGDSILPEGVKESYKFFNSDGQEIATIIDAGVYKVVVSFVGNSSNYEAIQDIVSTVTINPRIISIEDKIKLEDQTVNFDYKEHNLEIKGNLPDNVIVSYENNGQIYAGDYKVIANFSTDNTNEKTDIDKLEAYLIINQSRDNVYLYHEVEDESLIAKIKHSPLNDVGYYKYLTDDGIKLYAEFEGGFYQLILLTEEYIKIDNETRSLIIDTTANELSRDYIIYKYKIFDNNNLIYEFRNDDDVQNIPIENLTDGTIYKFEINFNYVNEDKNNSVILIPVSGNITYHAE